ncbi:hypothetical protein [Lewinella sp. JB7]|uniref:hypothetical protein n=1 Tax=Lewinella sp. JB7 TaxID=2962887 RepID=UPI0020CA1336|nr:hypothetical protein [Lewinella sp. JB7]MCP9235435.1 hypothetical protein [Lewinella sp. JB7]
MRTLVLSLLLSVVAATASAQIGVTGFRNFNDAYTRAGGSVLDLEYGDGAEIALNYWFRLPKKRVEFLPTVYYASTGGETPWSEYGFQFKTNVYPFDFGTDCDCPTFGKQGPQLQKGLFIQVSPGLANHHRAEGENTAVQNKIVPNVGAGIGIDFGVSNLLTLTPLVSVRHTLADFTDTGSVDESGDVAEGVNGRLTTVQIGVQATFRLDKKRY